MRFKKLTVFFVLSTGFLLYVPGGCMPLLFALPEGASVVSGTAKIEQVSPERLNVVQTTDKAIIDWRTFSIDLSEHTDFQMPSSSSVNLSRVTGGVGSEILGRLTSNGRLMLINPNGIMFGKNAQVDVNGLIATTIDIPNQDFMSGNYNFNIISDTPGVIANYGQINVAEGGLLAFVAPGVENYGIINARLGKVTLASGNTFTLDFYGDQLITLGVDSKILEQVIGADNAPLASLINNSGEINADGGIVALDVNAAGEIVDNVINMDGIIQARTVAEQNGEIILSGGTEGIVNVSGTLDASGKNAGELGGTVHVLGEKVGLFDNTLIDVSGDSGAGTVLVGGDFQGKGEVPNAKNTYVGKDAKINADALTNGDGGKVIVWADETTRYYGSISARAGAESGNAGFAEVSGAYIDFQGHVNLTAANGNIGTLLLDPDNIIIQDGGAGTEVATVNFGDAGDPGPNDSLFDGDDLAALDASITLEAHDDITINEAIPATTTAGRTLTINAGDDIIVNANISTNNGAITLTANALGHTPVSHDLTGDISMTDGTTINAGNATITLSSEGNIALSALSTTGSVSLTSTAGSIVDNGDSATDITANTLTMTAASGAVGSGNAIETAISNLGASGIGGVFNLTNSTSLDVTNTVSTTDANITLNLGANTLTLTGALDAGAANIDLTAASIVDGGGTTDITASTLTLNLSEDFGSGADAIETDIANLGASTLGTGTATGILNLDNGTTSLAITGAVTTAAANGAITLDVGTGTITTTGSLASGSGDIDLTAANINDNDAGTTDITTTGTLYLHTTSSVGFADAIDTAIANLGASSVGNFLTLDNGDTSMNITGAVSTGGDLNLYVGTGTFTIEATGSLDSGSSLTAINADSISLAGTISTTSTITLRPVTTTKTIGIAGGTGDFNLDATEIGLLQDGSSLITIGHPSGTGAIDCDAVTFTDSLTLRGGALTVTGLSTGANNLTLNVASVADGGDSATDITTTGTLAITASGAVGLGNAIDTAISNLGASTIGVALNLDNGATALNITDSISADSIDLIANNTITIQSDISATNDINITTTSGDIIGNNGVGGITWESSSGSINLDAANDLILGDTDWVWLDTFSGSGLGNITLTAGNDIIIDNNTDIQSNNGYIDITAYRNMQLLADSAAGIVANGAGDISITATTGNITIGANTAGVSSDGDITLTATAGSITIAPNTGGISSNLGTVTLSAETFISNASDISAESDLTLTTNTGNIIADGGTYWESSSGSIDLNAGNDLILGDTDWVWLDTFSGSGLGNITLTAGNDIRIDNDTYVESNDGYIDITANGNVELSASSGAAWIGADGAGDISITSTTGTTGSITIAAGTLGVSSTSGGITLTADSLALGENISSTGNLTLQPYSTTRAIGIASVTGEFDLSAAEIALLDDGFNSITIGRSDGTGAIDCDAITFSDPLTLYGGALTVTGLNIGANDLTLNVASVADGGGATDITANTLSMTLSGAFGSANTIETAIANLGASTLGGVLNLDNGDASLNITGVVNTTNSNITFDTGVGNLTLTGSLNAGNGDVTITSAAVIDGGDTATDITANLLTIDATSGIGSTNAIETEVAYMDIDNTTSGNIDLYETDSVTLTKINQAGPGDLTLSYSGTLTGEANATVTTGTLTLTNKGPAAPAIDPAIVESAVDQTVSYMNNIATQFNTLLFIPVNSSITSPTYAIRNTNPLTAPYVMNVFIKDFDIVTINRSFREVYEGLGIADSFWNTIGLLQP